MVTLEAATMSLRIALERNGRRVVAHAGHQDVGPIRDDESSSRSGGLRRTLPAMALRGLA
jgi:hypothetical protein